MKKSIKSIILAAIIMVLAACNGEKLSPVSEKIQGPLGEYFEVVSRDYKVNDGKVSVEVKHIKEGFPQPWEKGMDVGVYDGMFEMEFMVEFQDADGNVVSKEKTSIVNDIDELKCIANLGVGESSSITFACEEGATQFKMNSSFKTHGEAEKTVTLEGGIGKYPIVMTMHIAPNGEVTGAYYYKRKGPGNYLYIKGEKSKENIKLDEFTIDGEQTGTYEGAYKNGTYTGHFDTMSGNYKFVLKPSDAEAIDFSGIDFSKFEACSGMDYSTSGGYGGSNRVDAWLDAYEKYVNRYIAMLNRVKNGDMSAIKDYESMMNELKNLTQEWLSFEDITEEQLERYQKIWKKSLSK